MNEARCSQCKETKDLDTEFYNNRAMKNGKDTICKVCRKARQLEYSRKNPDYYSEYYFKVQKPRRRAAAAARRAAK